MPRTVPCKCVSTPFFPSFLAFVSFYSPGIQLNSISNGKHVAGDSTTCAHSTNSLWMSFSLLFSFSAFMLCVSDMRKNKSHAQPLERHTISSVLHIHWCMPRAQENTTNSGQKMGMAAVQAPFSLKGIVCTAFMFDSQAGRWWGCTWNLFSHTAPHARMQIVRCIRAVLVGVEEKKLIWNSVGFTYET